MALPRGTSYVILAVLTMPAMISSENEGKRHKFDVNFTAGLPNKVCPRLRDSACWRCGEITQPRKSLIREPCMRSKGYFRTMLLLAYMQPTLSPIPSL